MSLCNAVSTLVACCVSIGGGVHLIVSASELFCLLLFALIFSWLMIPPFFLLPVGSHWMSWHLRSGLIHLLPSVDLDLRLFLLRWVCLVRHLLMGRGRLAFYFLWSFLVCHWHLLVCLELFEDAVLPSSGHFYSSVLLMLASFEFRARGARLVSPRGFLCFSPKGLIFVCREMGLNLLCTFLVLSVVEFAEHSPRSFGQGVCGAPLSSFRTRGAAAGGKAGSLLETSRRLQKGSLTNK